MNREILFRGKSGDGWHYGLLTKYGNHKWRVVEEDNNMVTIKTNTIGQYTGLTDMNGTKIFEGDIIQSYHHREPMGVASVYWLGASFGCKLLSGSQFDCCDTLDEWDCECGLEIIGNIYDNPELLQENS